MSKYISYIACFLFGVILMYNLKCNKCPEQQFVAGKDSVVTKVFHDTAWVKVPPIRLKGKVVTVKDTTILNHTDTILADNNYFKTFIYYKSVNDTNVDINLIDTVSRNSIIGTNLEYKILRPTLVQTINTVNTIQRNKLLIGLQLKGSATSFGAVPTLIWVTKRDQEISGGYDVINKEIFAGAYLKIHL